LIGNAGDLHAASPGNLCGIGATLIGTLASSFIGLILALTIIAVGTALFF
jgi:hypothetical protein